jgi:hypothetical protein
MSEGSKLGTELSDGPEDGESEGISEGTMEGESLGINDGKPLGAEEGIIDGESLGISDGSIDGKSLGIDDGLLLRLGLNEILGVADGSSDFDDLPDLGDFGLLLPLLVHSPFIAIMAKSTRTKENFMFIVTVSLMWEEIEDCFYLIST